MTRISLALLVGAATLLSASAVSAADLLVNQPVASYGGYGGSTGGWDGAYAGGFIGYGWGTAAADGLTLADDIDLSGWTVGAKLGANFTVAPGFILGAEGDIAWSGNGGYDTTTNTDYDINWTSSLRGRAGYDAGTFMPYLTAGLAIAGATGSTGPTDNTQVHFGWTAGGGVEVAATEQVSIDLGYRYSDYGQATYDLTTLDDVDLSTHSVTAGVNFKF